MTGKRGRLAAVLRKAEPIILSIAMVTCDPNELIAPIHPKAMITILAPEDQQRWLTGSYDDVLALQRPYPAEQMTVQGPVFPTRQVRQSLVSPTPRRSR